eukprot:8288073-Lingulodinium_polyedra.AAC.1
MVSGHRTPGGWGSLPHARPHTAVWRLLYDGRPPPRGATWQGLLDGRTLGHLRAAVRTRRDFCRWRRRPLERPPVG